MSKHRGKWWTNTKVTNTYLVAFMLVLCFVAYDAFTQPMPSRKPDSQTILNSQVPAAKPGPPPVASPVGNGKALVYIDIPRFGKQWHWTALEGVSLDVLNQGPGHYPNTVLPGDKGNTSFAAHRAGHGDPFINFDKLEIGDKVIFSQPGGRWTYTITKAPVIISANAKWVTDTFAPGRWLTLTTCYPKYGSSERMYIRAELTSAESLTVPGR